jgi:protein crumbs
VRIGGYLLPFFTPSELGQLHAPVQFKIGGSGLGLTYVRQSECVLCYDDECRNGARCADPLTEFKCACLPGFTGENRN